MKYIIWFIILVFILEALIYCFCGFGLVKLSITIQKTGLKSLILRIWEGPNTKPLMSDPNKIKERR